MLARRAIVSVRRLPCGSTQRALALRHETLQTLVPQLLNSLNTIQPLSQQHCSTRGFHRTAGKAFEIPPPSPGDNFLGRAANFDVTKQRKSAAKWKWLAKLFRFNSSEPTHWQQSLGMLQSCVNQAALPDLYRALSLKPDFRGQQAMLMAHIWMVHHRLAMEPTETSKLMQEMMFDRLWEDTMSRIRFEQVSELTVNKHLAQVQRVCFSGCVRYDVALKEMASRPRAFQEAVALNVFDVDISDQQQDNQPTKEEDQVGSAEELDLLPKDQVERSSKLMAEYMKREIKMLAKKDVELIVKGVIQWGNPPPVPRDAPPFDPEVVLIGQKIGNWRTALDANGRLFYWNLTTRESSWERPQEIQ